MACSQAMCSKAQPRLGDAAARTQRTVAVPRPVHGVPAAGCRQLRPVVCNSSSGSNSSGGEVQRTAGASGISVNGYSPTSMQGWLMVKEALRDANVKIISAQEVVFAQERGVPVVDVRPEDAFASAHIPGSKNVPFYQPIQGWDPMKVARRVGFALFGVLNGTEVNPNFVKDASAYIDPEKGVILYCSIGGSLEPTQSSKKGLQSRSLIAAWQLVSQGYTNISILKGGFGEWVSNGREVHELVES